MRNAHADGAAYQSSGDGTLLQEHRDEVRRKDMEVASWCTDMEFNLTGKEGEETIEVVSLFTYLGRTLDQ